MKYICKKSFNTLSAYYYNKISNIHIYVNKGEIFDIIYSNGIKIIYFKNEDGTYGKYLLSNHEYENFIPLREYNINKIIK